MSIWSDLLGTTKSIFGIGLSGVKLKDSSGNLLVRNNSDNANSEITASKVNVSGPDVVFDSDGNALTVSRNSAQSGALQVIFPSAKATDGQVIAQKSGTGAGVIEFEFVSAGSNASSDKIDTTSLAFGSSSPVAMFSTGAADIIEYIDFIVDTAFNGTAPTATVGISGTTSKYTATTDVNLKVAGQYRVHPGVGAQGAEALIITYSADSSSAGAARVLVHYATPA